jgi:nucleoid-associated protein YgaU
MPNRYDDIKTVINSSEIYSNYLEQRGKKFIEQLPTYVFKPVTEKIKTSIKKESHIWSFGDRYFNLSVKYYDDARYWWLIAWFNEKPTEQHLNPGDVLYIPLPLNEALRYYYGG